MSGLVPSSVPVVDTDLATWAATFEQMARVATQLAATPFVPQSLRATGPGGAYDQATTASNVTAAILTGAELRLSPMAALRSIAIIQGTPAVNALALRAIVQREGHGVWLREATNTRAVVEGRRAGEDESRTQRITWTLDDAKARGLSNRDNWRRQPRNMLIARATAEVCRLVAADAILGIAYSIEELQDGDDNTETLETPKPPRMGGNGTTKRTARRRQAQPIVQRTAPPPELSEPEPADEPPIDDQPPGPPMITDAQRRALLAGFKDLGVTNRDERLAAVRLHIERDDINSANDLTRAEASSVIAELQRLKTAFDKEHDEDLSNPDPAEEEPEPDEEDPGRPY